MSKSTTRKTSRSSKVFDVILRVGYSAVLICATIVLTWSFGYLQHGDWYGFVGTGYWVLYLLFAPTLVMLILGRKVSKFMRFVSLAWLPVVTFVIILLSEAMLRDAQGARCTGFFGATTSCASVQYIIVLVLLFNPYTLLAWMSLTILALLKGWYDYFEDRRMAKRPHSKPPTQS